MRRTHLVAVLSLLLGLLPLMPAARQTVQAAPAELEEAVKQAATKHLGATPNAQMYVSVISRVDDWTFGTNGIIPDDDETTPQILLFLAKTNGSSWTVAIENTTAFRESLAQIPNQLLTSEQRATLDPRLSATGDGSAQLSLPYATGETWALTGGPHGGTREALDFSGGSGNVRAAREGVAYVTCPLGSGAADFIRIDHRDGWKTGYYHISGTAVSNGQSVGRGTYLGRTGNSAVCLKGSSSGAHVHFWVEKGTAKVAAHNLDIGGWTVEYSGTEYNGCMTRIKDGLRRCADMYGRTGSHIYNDGTIGSGTASPCNAPGLQEPSDGAAINSRTITFRWSAVSGCTFNGYTFRVKDTSNMDSGGTQIIDTGEGGTQRTETINGWDNRDLFWGVRAANAPTGAAWAVRRFRITVDTTNPTGNIIAPADGNTTSNPAFTIIADASDDLSGVRHVQFHANYNGEWHQICTDTDAPYSCDWNANALDDQSIIFTIHVEDNAGNKAIDPGGYRTVRLQRRPITPQNLRILSTTGSSIQLAWDDTASEDGYKIYKWDGVKGDFLYRTSVGRDVTTFSDESLNCGSDYWYQVSAFNANGDSERTGWVHGTTATCPAIPQVSVTDTTDTSVTLNWLYTGPSIDGFRIYRWDGSDGSWKLNKTVGSNVTTYTNTGLTCESSYYYQVAAYNGSGESPRPDWVTANTTTCGSATKPQLFLNPNAIEAGVNQTFSVDLKIELAGETADTVDAYLDFNPQYLQVVDASGVPTNQIEVNDAVFNGATINSVDNATGHIDFSASKFASPYLTGTFKAATIRFRVKTATSSTDISFVESGSRQSDLLRSGSSISPSIADATVTPLADMILNGRVALERRGTQGDQRWITPLSRVVQGSTVNGIILYQAGTNLVQDTFATTTDANGRFSVTLTGVPAGTYDIRVKGANTLSNKKLRVTLPAVAEIDFGMLLVGDSSGDDVVNGADVSYMIPSFLTSAADANFRPYADTNNDGLINGTDISALIPNFLTSGPVVTSNQSVGMAAERSTADRANLTLNPSTHTAKPGDIFTVDIAVDTGLGTADTVDAYLDFDPRYLEVVDASGSPVTKVEVNKAIFSSTTFNTVDNSTGHINFSASKYSSPFLTGSFVTATIRFRIRAAFNSTNITFASSGARRSDVLSAGESMKPTLGDGSILQPAVDSGPKRTVFLPLIHR